MWTTIASYFTGRAAKAGMAALFGALAGMGGAGTTEWAINDALPVVEGNLALWQYLAIGAASGFVNWIMTFSKPNRATEKQRQAGLF